VPPAVRLPGLVLLLVAALAASTLATVPAGTAAGADDDRARVARLAGINGLSIAQMRDLLRDPAVRLTDTGRAYYVDEGATGRVGPTAARGVAPLGRTFGLHSKPGSRRTIFLDFDGSVVKDTAWNRQVGVRNGWHPGWDPANNGASFTDREKRIVQSVWARVAEDYAPFDIDVTTEEPPAARIHRTRKRDKVFGTRVLISESGNAHSRICSRRCGGVSFLNVFSAVGRAHRRHQPSWVFPAGLRNDVKAVAEAATHEAGHTFGLVHDGALLTDYYTGHGSWAPIMGAAYERPISQWSKGSYSGATSHQDDLAIIAGRGAPFRRDDAGSRPSSAARPPQGPAYISRRGDVDVYRLGTCTGRIKVRAVVAKISPNLDVRLRLILKGRVVASANPPSATVSRDKASGMNAALARQAKRGIYYAAVDGVGRGSASSSYDDYGSLGTYKLTVSGC
jgi:hypothetical protein